MRSVDKLLKNTRASGSAGRLASVSSLSLGARVSAVSRAVHIKTQQMRLKPSRVCAACCYQRPVISQGPAPGKVQSTRPEAGARSSSTVHCDAPKVHAGVVSSPYNDAVNHGTALVLLVRAPSDATTCFCVLRQSILSCRASVFDAGTWPLQASEIRIQPPNHRRAQHEAQDHQRLRHVSCSHGRRKVKDDEKMRVIFFRMGASLPLACRIARFVFILVAGDGKGSISRPVRGVVFVSGKTARRTKPQRHVVCMRDERSGRDMELRAALDSHSWAAETTT
eukprot:2810220-Pleurochrysis_carterae.AAC.2